MAECLRKYLKFLQVSVTIRQKLPLNVPQQEEVVGTSLHGTIDECAIPFWFGDVYRIVMLLDSRAFRRVLGCERWLR